MPDPNFKCPPGGYVLHAHLSSSGSAESIYTAVPQRSRCLGVGVAQNNSFGSPNLVTIKSPSGDLGTINLPGGGVQATEFIELFSPDANNNGFAPGDVLEIETDGLGGGGQPLYVTLLMAPG